MSIIGAAPQAAPIIVSGLNNDYHTTVMINH